MTLQTAIRQAQTVNAVDFGADPQGVNDSTDAINAALATGAGHVVVPAGTYSVRTIDFSPWGIPGQEFRPFVLDAPGAWFKHNDAEGHDFAVLKIFAGASQQILRAALRIGFVSGSNVDNLVYIRHFNNSRFEAAFVGPGPVATGVFVDQANNPAFGTFNNFIDIQDVADCRDGMTVNADNFGVNGFEGNQVKIGRIGFNAQNGLTAGSVKDARVTFNTFLLGPIEHNNGGYGIYERGGGNQFYVNNLNSNRSGIGGLAGLLRKSMFNVSNQDSVDAAIVGEHLYKNIYQGR
jgi:hypothetical protein